MSQRPEISGFSLAKLRSLFGAGDPVLCDRAVAEALEVCSHESDDFKLDVEAHVRAIVMGDLVPGSIDQEDDALVVSVIALAQFEQAHADKDSSKWKGTHSEWALDLPKQASGDAETWKRARQLVDDAVLGRPLFGNELENYWTVYGYLTLAEVQELLDLRSQFSELTNDEYGFAEEFFGWLESIAAAGQDYWFVAR